MRDFVLWRRSLEEWFCRVCCSEFQDRHISACFDLVPGPGMAGNAAGPAEQVSFFIQNERFILMLSKLYPVKPVLGLSGVAGSNLAGPTVSAYCQGSLQCRQASGSEPCCSAALRRPMGHVRGVFWSFHQ